MRFLESAKWQGAGVIITAALVIAGFWMGPTISNAISQKSVELLLISSTAESISFTDQDAKALFPEGSKIRRLERSLYYLSNSGNKALTPEDFISPIAVRSTEGFQIVGVFSSLATGAKNQDRWIQDASGQWQMPPTYLNPKEDIIISVLVSSDSLQIPTVTEIKNHLSWFGRFKEISTPKTVDAILSVGENPQFFLIWRAFGIFSLFSGWRVFVYLLIAIASFAAFNLVFLQRPRKPVFGWFMAIQLYFVVLSICVADSLAPANLPSELIDFYWINYIAPILAIGTLVTAARIRR